MAQLPTVIRRDIRDQVDAVKGTLQQQLKALKATVGYSVTCNVDWAMLWVECEPYFEDKSTFIPCVVSQILALCNALAAKLEDESSPWAESLLEKLEPVGTMKLCIQATPNRNAFVRFSHDRAFILNIPSRPSTSPTSNNQLLQDLHAAFSPRIDAQSVEDDDWAAVITPAASTSDLDQSHSILTPSSFSSVASGFLPTARSAPSKISTLPTLSSLPRPDLLFSRSGPHIIHMRIERNCQVLAQTPASSYIDHLPERITFQSTHEGSLKLIHDYFSKWTRADPQTREKIPLLRYTLGPSCIGPGACYDTLAIEPFSQASARSGACINATMFQYFVERVLGYEMVGRCSESVSVRDEGEFWEFRRMTAFVD